MPRKTRKKQSSRAPHPASLLLYGIELDSPQDRTLTMLADSLSLRLVRTNGEDLGKPVMDLIGFGTASVCTKPYDGPAFHVPFLLMAGLNEVQQNRVLSALRSNQTPIDLKAVLTETNRKWSLGALIREVAQEHLALHHKTT